MAQTAKRCQVDTFDFDGQDYVLFSVYEKLFLAYEKCKSYAKSEHQARQVAEEKATELASQLYLYEGWVANPTFQGAVARVMVGTHLAMEKSRAKGDLGPDGKPRVWRNDAAELSGVSVSTVSNVWGKLQNSGLVDRESDAKVTDGKFDKPVYLNFTPQAYANPSGAQLVGERHGGTRIPECPHCHSVEYIRPLPRRFMCTNPKCDHLGVSVAENELAWVSENLLAYEAEQREREEQEAAAAAAAAIAAEEQEAWQLIAWIKEHGGRVDITSVGFPVFDLPDEIKYQTWKKIRDEFKRLEAPITRLMKAA